MLRHWRNKESREGRDALSESIVDEYSTGNWKMGKLE